MAYLIVAGIYFAILVDAVHHDAPVAVIGTVFLLALVFARVIAVKDDD